jgi:hypothetical protein
MGQTSGISDYDDQIVLMMAGKWKACVALAIGCLEIIPQVAARANGLSPPASFHPLVPSA